MCNTKLGAGNHSLCRLPYHQSEAGKLCFHTSCISDKRSPKPRSDFQLWLYYQVNKDHGLGVRSQSAQAERDETGNEGRNIEEERLMAKNAVNSTENGSLKLMLPNPVPVPFMGM